MKRLLKFFRLKKRRNVILRATGAHHNLQAIYDQINANYFEGKLELGITWIGNRLARPRTRIVLGSYHLHQNVIRINRILDHPNIPHYFVAYIVYHEMLHSVIDGSLDRRGRYCFHSPAFKEREKEFEHYALAVEWEQKNKNALFKYGWT